MKQHSKKNESNPVTNISGSKNNNITPGVCTKRKDEESEIKDGKSEVNEKKMRKQTNNLENEYQETLEVGKGYDSRIKLQIKYNEVKHQL